MTVPDAWTTPTDTAKLGGGAVHLWRIALDHLPGCVGRLRRLLAGEERVRADSFHFDIDRNRFIAGRAALRLVLAQYLARAPENLVIGYGVRGKPFLKDANGVTFNLSHSHDVALLAVTQTARIGVDIERVDGRVAEGVAEMAFSPAEKAALRALPVAERERAFYACWTRKEAYIKAHGDGLGLPLDSFTVSVSGPAALLHASGAPDESRCWQLAQVDAGAGYAAALAIEAPHLTLSCWRWAWSCGCPAA